MTELSYENFDFTPTESLILEVLTARYRLGERSWTFEARVNKALTSLAEKKLVAWKSGSVEGTSLVWFTLKGKTVMLDRKFTPRTGWRGLKRHNKELRKEVKRFLKSLKKD